jgi:broad specificity phosphatase PhoE
MKEQTQRHEMIFLRHGRSIANQEHLVQGQQDSPLSETGVEQVRALATLWKSEGVNFDHIISSPLERAAMTARIIAETIKAEIEPNESWMERRYGNAEGMKYSEFRELLNKNPRPSPYKSAFGTGESEWDLFLRASSAIQELLKRPPGHYLVVSHGGILNAALQSILGVSPSSPIVRTIIRFDNTGHTKVTYDDFTQMWRINYTNDRRHLISSGLDRQED